MQRTFLHHFQVRISHKFKKLGSRDAVQSLWEHACRWTHPVNPRRILATIDRAELERLRERYPYRPNARRINAYEDAAYWVGVNVKRVQDLWLDRSPPLQILDLGCGPGYFLYLCRLFLSRHNSIFRRSSRDRADQSTNSSARSRKKIRSRHRTPRLFSSDSTQRKRRMDRVVAG